MTETKHSLRYYKLFDLLNRRGLSKGQLRESTGFSSTTIAKLSSGKPVNTTVIDRICETLNCQPADIMEYVPDKDNE